MNTFKTRYVFDSKEQFETKWNGLKDRYEEDETPFYHAKEERGYVPFIVYVDVDIEVELFNEETGELEMTTITVEEKQFTKPTFDEDGEIILAPLNMNEYIVDVVYRGIEENEEGEGLHPYGFKMHHVTPAKPMFQWNGYYGLEDKMDR